MVRDEYSFKNGNGTFITTSMMRNDAKKNEKEFLRGRRGGGGQGGRGGSRKTIFLKTMKDVASMREGERERERGEGGREGREGGRDEVFHFKKNK